MPFFRQTDRQTHSCSDNYKWMNEISAIHPSAVNNPSRPESGELTSRRWFSIHWFQLRICESCAPLCNVHYGGQQCETTIGRLISGGNNIFRPFKCLKSRGAERARSTTISWSLTDRATGPAGSTHLSLTISFKPDATRREGEIILCQAQFPIHHHRQSPTILLHMSHCEMTHCSGWLFRDFRDLTGDIQYFHE